MIDVFATLAPISVMFAISLGMSPPALGQRIEVLGPLHAQGVTVLRIEVDQLPEVGSILVEIKGTGDDGYRAVDLLNTGDAVIRGREFSKTSRGPSILVVPMFVTGAKSIATARHPFDLPGRYSIRLRSNEGLDHGVPPAEDVLVETEIELAKSTAADQKYFELAREEPVSALLGIDDLDETTADGERLAGVALMAAIVESTRQQGDPTHGQTEWAEPLYDLAFAVPDSSYAPYLAYYAACSYMWQRKGVYVRKEFGYELPDRRIADLVHYQRARTALEFAVRRGDSYIKPFATCFLAGMKAWAADLDGARALLQTLDVNAHESRQINQFVDELDRFIRAEERQEVR